MQYRSTIVLAAFAVLAACADSPTSPGSDPLFLGNPPPPSIGGTAFGDFETSTGSGLRSTNMGGLSLEVTGGEGGTTGVFAFHFAISPVEFNADPSLQTMWMNFPKQTPPPDLAQRLRNVKRGRIFFNGTATTGTGTIWALDREHNGYWTIDLRQFTGQGNVFTDCEVPVGEVCVRLNKRIIAVFVQIVGEREDGSLIVKEYVSKPGLLFFASGI